MKILDEIIHSMKKIGGNVTLKDLYDDLMNKNVHQYYLDESSFKGSVRGELQSYWKKSNRFNGRELFENVGRGIWKLKNIKEEIINEARPEKINIFIDSKDNEMFALSETRVFFRSVDHDLFPEIIVGNRENLRWEIDSNNFLHIFFKDRKQGDWEIGFDLKKNILMDVLKLIDDNYEVSFN